MPYHATTRLLLSPHRDQAGWEHGRGGVARGAEHSAESSLEIFQDACCCRWIDITANDHGAQIFRHGTVRPSPFSSQALVKKKKKIINGLHPAAPPPHLRVLDLSDQKEPLIAFPTCQHRHPVCRSPHLATHRQPDGQSTRTWTPWRLRSQLLLFPAGSWGR